MRSEALAASADNIVLHAVAGAQEMPDEYVRIPAQEQRREERQLRQCTLPGRWRRLALFNGHYLEYSARGQTPRVINLAYLSPQPMQVRENAWRWLMAALVLTAGATVTGVFHQMLQCSVLAALAVATLAGYLVSVRERLVFRTRFGGIAVFEMAIGLLHRRQAESFLALLQERIQGGGEILPVGEERLAAEMAEHRRMLQDGWLSRTRYDLAKQRIFSRYRKGDEGRPRAAG